MKYRLELQEPVKTKSLTGFEATAFAPRATVWAERARMTGSYTNSNGEHFSDYRTTFNIRINHTVGEGWRAQQLGGNLYLVKNIIPNLDRGYLSLECERVNK